MNLEVLYTPEVRPWAELFKRGEREHLAGQPEQALESLRQALDLLGRSVPNDVMLRVVTLERIAALEGECGNNETAVRVYESSLSLLREQKDPQAEVELATSLTTVAKRHLRLGNLKQAEDCANEACAHYERHLGKDHPFRAIAQITIARVRYARGDLDGALLLTDEILQPLKGNTKFAADVIWNQQLRAQILNKLGRVGDALDTLRAAAAQAESVFSATASGAQARSEINTELCELLLTSGHAALARQVAWNILGDLEKYFPANAPIMANARKLLSVALDAIGRKGEKELLREVSEEDELELLNMANRRWQYLLVRTGEQNP